MYKENNGDILKYLYIFYMMWTLFQTHYFYHIFWEAVGLERGPLSLMSKTGEQLESNSSGSSLENRG
jgi:hypothetical protein